MADLQTAGTDITDLNSSLDSIRDAGYVVTDGEVDAGVWGVSAPIFQRPHMAVASITVMAPSTRAVQRADILTELTVAAAKRISHRLQSR